MTRKRLEEYRSNKDEIRELEYKLAHLNDDDSLVSNDTILDYRTGFPRPQAVIGMDWERKASLATRYRELLEKLRTECAEVEDWVNSIPDGITRRIFRMRFVEGMEMEAICIRIHADRSTVYRRIERELRKGGVRYEENISDNSKT